MGTPSLCSMHRAKVQTATHLRFSEGSHRLSSSDSEELSDELFSFVVFWSPAAVSWLVSACVAGWAGSSLTLNFMSGGISPPKLVSRRKILDRRMTNVEPSPRSNSCTRRKTTSWKMTSACLGVEAIYRLVAN